jgi:hypothetical protein
MSSRPSWRSLLCHSGCPFYNRTAVADEGRRRRRRRKNDQKNERKKIVFALSVRFEDRKARKDEHTAQCAACCPLRVIGFEIRNRQKKLTIFNRPSFFEQPSFETIFSSA